ncbi:unnamed protein product [Toxocara canis]|uniref:Uncharacterized protein n=1 Tax=Toxocara canis TaxID=6265 RepID=A0A183UXI1_TOXCA|nr:unnamed protein product [Toxocara canis]
MSESGSLATSSTGSDPDPFSQLLASMARPIPNSITASINSSLNAILRSRSSRSQIDNPSSC